MDHREVLAKRYKNSRPGLEDTKWGRQFKVPDPFGNRLRFAERKKTG